MLRRLIFDGICCCISDLFEYWEHLVTLHCSTILDRILTVTKQNEQYTKYVRMIVILQMISGDLLQILFVFWNKCEIKENFCQVIKNYQSKSVYPDLSKVGCPSWLRDSWSWLTFCNKLEPVKENIPIYQRAWSSLLETVLTGFSMLEVKKKNNEIFACRRKREIIVVLCCHGYKLI